MRVKGGHAAHDERRHGHHHKKPHWLEVSGHGSALDNHTRLFAANILCLQ
jgi:hypothetical protein